MTTPNDILMDRLRRLRQALDETGLHAVVLRDASHRRYITGFTGSTGWAVITGTRAWLVTDGRYWERAREEAPHFELVPVRTSYKDALQALFRDLEGPVGFEAETVTVDEFERLYRPASHVDGRRADAILHRLRQVKDEEEMALLRQAAAITDAAARALPSLLRPGVSEREVAWELEKYMREHGAEALAFPMIVAFGENSALPHAEPGDRRLRPEMAVCVDMGARVAGYCADLTRSFWYGREPEEEYVKAWEATRWALTAALVGLRPGLRGRYVDALARDALGVRGMGSTSCTAWGTAWAWTSTNVPGSAATATTSSPRARSSPWNRGSTSPTAGESDWKNSSFCGIMDPKSSAKHPCGPC